MDHRHGKGNAECRAIFERLSEYIDGDLPEDICCSVEDHMVDCAPCEKFLESMRRTVRWIQNVDAPPLPDEIRRSVSEAYERYRRDTGRA